jgi:signal transduction histidine kinase
MLVMLIGVTTFLLVIMGGVSTYLLARRVDGQIAQLNTAIRSRLNYEPSILAKPPHSSFPAVEVVFGQPLTAYPLTKGPLTAELVTAVNTWLRQPSSAFLQQFAGSSIPTDPLLYLTGRPTRCSQFPYAGCAPYKINSGMLAASAVIPASWVVLPSSRNPHAHKSPSAGLLFVGHLVSTAPAQVRGFILAEVITGAALIALVALGGEWLIGQGLEPLDEMTVTAKEITTQGDLTARMPDSDDQTEVGRLGLSINTMLDYIQQAFSMRLNSEQKVREFAADASHELRTPLTTIRGYAELYRQGALGPDQLPNAMRRIEQEAHRMSTLVAELLELARLDRTSSLDLTETDLASVVRDAVADAVAVEPFRPVRAEAPPRLVAVVDEPRIRQVVANLLGNVRAHTPSTTPVAVRLGAITGGVLLEVADAGPGMSVGDAIRAFDRFHRASERSAGGWDLARSERAPAAAGVNGSPPVVAGANGRSSAAELSGGSGLGLSIVQAIANAHGGRATLESRPGKGTKVRVWLPVRVVS